VIGLKKKIGCLHAHYSNIDYIESAFSAYDLELSHYVDPGLIYRLKNDQVSEAEKKVKDQIEWIAQSGVDAILITCTNYIALLNQIEVNIPIIKIDEPYFEALCKTEQPQTILFTNPDTVSGTMARLEQYAKKHHTSLDIVVKVIENSFELIMSGKQEEYQNVVCHYIKQLDSTRSVSVAQLSMVAAAQQVELETSIPIINPLTTLVSSMVNQLNLQKIAEQ
jgi:aspartate/glutamate racemase